jgi:heparanase 1
VNGTTNAFVSSLWYADWLGFAAKSGVAAVFRETLMVSGSYVVPVHSPTAATAVRAAATHQYTKAAQLLLLTASSHAAATQGGYYEVVDHSSYLPNPDAFTMILFSQLMGPKVLEVSLQVSTDSPGAPPNATQMLRGYAHCARAEGRGSTLLLINLASETAFNVTLPMPQKLLTRRAMPVSAIHKEESGGVGRGAQRAAAATVSTTEWHLTPPDGDIHAKLIELNGEVLALGGVNHSQLPSMAGRPAGIAHAVLVGPSSVVFVSLPASASPACD